MLFKVITGCLEGVNAVPVTVEINRGRGLPSLSLVGMADTTIKESRERVKTAIINSGFPFPPKKYTINLSPADMKKEGTLYDLPIALGLLGVNEHIYQEAIDSWAVIGELSLDGRLRPVRGILPMLAGLKDHGIKKFMVPPGNSFEASIVKNIEVYTPNDLLEASEFLAGRIELESLNNEGFELIMESNPYQGEDFIDVRGQESAKRSLIIAACGSHNLLLEGPPGSGKTMLARRLPGILPEMSFEEAVETSKIYSISGLLTSKNPLITSRPFRSPHHTVTRIGLIGGGKNPMPGEVSLSNNGVLFLDELPEFQRQTLEVLRQPLEDGFVEINRIGRSLRYPSKIMLVAAMNPCPCGYLSDPQRQCTCNAGEIIRYRNKLSGPLLDRIDMRLHVPAVPLIDLEGVKRGMSTREMSCRVNQAREMQTQRFKGCGIHFNSQMKASQIEKYVKLDSDAQNMLSKAVVKYNLSARSYMRIRKVSRTIADLDESETVKVKHVMEAVSYRICENESGQKSVV